MLMLNSFRTIADWQAENIIRHDYIGRGGKEYMKHLIRSQSAHVPVQDHHVYTTLDTQSTLY
ncbi:MAG: hypothetical protein WBA57_08775 [Elainellaceae cyanobacterium]